MIVCGSTHMATVLQSPVVTLRAMTWNGDPVGSIASFIREGQNEVTYWIDRSAWVLGIASRALPMFREVARERPL